MAQIQERWPPTRIIYRGDSSFCREPPVAWCEASQVDYVFGLAKNKRPLELRLSPRVEAQVEYVQTQEPGRRVCEFVYRTVDTWSRERCVVAKAKYLQQGANPCFG